MGKKKLYGSREIEVDGEIEKAIVVPALVGELVFVEEKWLEIQSIVIQSNGHISFLAKCKSSSEERELRLGEFGTTWGLVFEEAPALEYGEQRLLAEIMKG